MKRVTVVWIIFLALALSACGGGGGGGGSASGEEVNNPPVANAGLDQTGMVGDMVTLDGSGSTDPDDNIVSYTWVQTNGPTVTLSDPSAVTTKFVASVPENSQLTFELTVKDAAGKISKDACTITVVKRAKNAPIADAGYDRTVKKGSRVTLDGSGSRDLDNNIVSYHWAQKTGPPATLINPDNQKPYFDTNAIPDNSILTFELTVTDSENLSDTDTCTIAVVKLGNLLTQKEAQDVLFATYAGIGYMNADDADDDERLYNIMVGDLNMVVIEIMKDTILNDPYAEIKLLKFYWGSKVVFSYDNGYYQANLQLENGKKLSNLTQFVGTLSIDFSSPGPAYRPSNGHCTYWGAVTNTNDLNAVITGYYKPSLVPQDQEIYFKSVSITANPTLRASYPDDSNPLYIAAYNTWNISYQIYYGLDDPLYQEVKLHYAINMYLLPPDYWPQLSYTDFRDYTIDGSFSVNGTTSYTFSKGFNYIQKQFDINGKTYVMVGIDGALSIPGSQTSILISSPHDFEDPVGQKTINKVLELGIDDDGIWDLGKMTLTGDNTAVDVEFNHGTPKGNAVFSSGILGNWTVNDWQDSLAPF